MQFTRNNIGHDAIFMTTEAASSCMAISVPPILGLYTLHYIHGTLNTVPCVRTMQVCTTILHNHILYSVMHIIINWFNIKACYIHYRIANSK